MPVSMKIVKNNTHGVATTLKNLTLTRVLAGVPSFKADRGLNDDGDDQDVNNAGLMFIHENGAPEANIPARPVMHPAMSEIRPRVSKMLKLAGRYALEGSKDKMMKQFYAIGFVAQNAMRKKITVGPFAPLAESTLAKRRAKGHNSTKPLIDTGQLRRALTFVIRYKKQDLKKGS